MTNYKTLINKYYKPEGKNPTAQQKHNPSEKTSKEYNRQQKREQYRRHRQLILTTLLNEIPFHITHDQTTQIQYWINRFNNNFREFHKNSSNETIILAFIFIQYKKANPQVNVEKYSISYKYSLNTSKFTLIQNRLIFKLMSTTELQYNQYTYYKNRLHENKNNKEAAPQ